MKFVFTVALFIFFATATWAQNPRETLISLKKQNHTAVIADYTYSDDLTKAALLQKLEGEGITKGRSEKGFIVFRKVTWPGIMSETVDIYIKVSGKKNRSTVAILISTGYDNFINAGSDPQAIEQLKIFLNNFTQDIVAYKKQQEVTAAEKELEAAKKQLEKASKASKEEEAKRREELKKAQEKLQQAGSGK